MYLLIGIKKIYSTMLCLYYLKFLFIVNIPNFVYDVTCNWALYEHKLIQRCALMSLIEQNRTDYLFDVNYTVSSQSNTIIINISRSQMLSEYVSQVVVLI